MEKTENSYSSKRFTKALLASLTAVLIVMLALGVVSCSVKEDRDVCPAWLVVRSDGHVAEGASLAGGFTYRVSPSFGAPCEIASGTHSEFTSEGRAFRVPRKHDIFVDVFEGASGMELTDTLLRIPFGSECDALFCGSGTTWVPADDGVLPLPLNRNHAKVTVVLKGDILFPYPYSFVFKGGVDGYSIPGLAPHHGAFSCRKGIIAAKSGCSARVPRQTDDSLEMELRSISDDSLVHTVPLGLLAAQTGYDWNEPDLKDIRIELDFARSILTLIVGDWTLSTTYLFVI